MRDETGAPTASLTGEAVLLVGNGGADSSTRPRARTAPRLETSKLPSPAKRIDTSPAKTQGRRKLTRDSSAAPRAAASSTYATPGKSAAPPTTCSEKIAAGDASKASAWTSTTQAVVPRKNEDAPGAAVVAGAPREKKRPCAIVPL